MIYGHDRTLHQTVDLDVEVDGAGQVVAVWFRCMALPFRVSSVDQSRAKEMRAMYRASRIRQLEAVVVEDLPGDAR